MTAVDINHPVALLRDAKGVYGIGVIRNVDGDKGPKAPELILRPDRLSESKPHRAALQMITGGFRRGPFKHTSEEELRRAIHHELLRRKGLAWPPEESWRSLEPRRGLKNWQTYHGLRLRSLALINRLISEALETAANPTAVALARRFPMRQRYSIYRVIAQSHRALQLTETFPALSVAIYARQTLEYGFLPPRPTVDVVLEARRLVEAGAPLRTIAGLMGVPMAFRKVKPGAAALAQPVIGAFEDPRLVDAYMPVSLPVMKLWLKCLHLARTIGPDFVEWTARHATEIVGARPLTIFMDLADWVRACHSFFGPQFVVRQFSADMSLATVTRLSRDWHEAVAANVSGPNCEFPEPWCAAGRSGEFDVVPITTSAELYREGNLLHHCVGSYQGLVHAGKSYIYSVRQGDVRVATLELRRNGGGIAIGQVRGACNVPPPKQVALAVRSWVRSQREFRFPPEPGSGVPLDDDIPF